MTWTPNNELDHDSLKNLNAADYQHLTGTNKTNLLAHLTDTTNPHDTLLSVTDDAQLKISSNLEDVADQQTALDNITAVSTATIGHVLTKDALGNATFEEASGGGGTDENAIHDNVSNEINVIAEKTTPVGNDSIIIEDSEDLYAKKLLKIANIPGGAPITAYGLYWDNRSTGQTTSLVTEAHWECNTSAGTLPACSTGVGQAQGRVSLLAGTYDCYTFLRAAVFTSATSALVHMISEVGGGELSFAEAVMTPGYTAAAYPSNPITGNIYQKCRITLATTTTIENQFQYVLGVGQITGVPNVYPLSFMLITQVA